MKLGYGGVSSNEEKLDREVEELCEYGCEGILEEKIMQQQMRQK